jgi:hypothetical protein
MIGALGDRKGLHVKKPAMAVLAALAVATVAATGCHSTGNSNADRPVPSTTALPSTASTSQPAPPVTGSTGPLPSTTLTEPTRSPRPSTSGTGCRSGDPLANVYHEDRLSVKDPCMTVSGTVMSVTLEADGDTHFDLALDPAYTSLLTPANESGQNGWLVVEIVPADKPGCTPGTPPVPASGTYDYGICTGANEVSPATGTHVSVTGPYVLDLDHGGWAEIHPVWAITNLGATSGPAAPSSPSTLAPLPTDSVPPAGPQTGVTIVSVTSPVEAGAYATLVARTAANASCHLSVILPSGRESQSSGLGPATADAAGHVQWTWLTGTRTEPGTARAALVCGGESATTTFQLTS